MVLPRPPRLRCARGDRRSARDSPPGAPLLTAMSTPARRRIEATRAVVVVLPAVPVMPMLGPFQRSSTRSPRHETRAPRARSFSTRGATSGVQTSRYAISASPGSASRSTLGWTSIPSSRSSPAARGSGSGLAMPNRVALTGQQSGERNRVRAEALDQNIHTQIIAGRRRSLARRHEGRRVDQALYRVAAADRGAHR